MARRSNKTAHVLNLLAGHDSQNTTEDTAANEAAPSPSEAAPESETTQPSAKDEIPETVRPAKADPEPVTANTPVSSQNISVIDTTGTDPVAELIQQELANQFESELAAASPGAASDSEADTTEALATAAVSDSDTVDSTETEADSETAEAAASQPEPIVESESAAAPESEPVVTPEPELTAAAEPVATPEPEPVVTPEPEPTATAESVTVPEPESVAAAEPVITPEPESVSAPGSEAGVTPGPAPEAAPEPERAPEPEPDFVYLNIMEEIVKDKIIYFMRQFDICTCDRCKADTIALTMNGLMPKYVVTTPAAVAPLVSYYTNRLIPDVTVEAIKACMTVKDNPRH